MTPIAVKDAGPFLVAARESIHLHRPWVYPPTSGSAFTGFVADGLNDRRVRLLLWSRAHLARGERDVALVGYFSLGEIVRGGLESAYLGYWVSAAYAGQGAMAEGIELAFEAAFSRLHLHRVEANIQPENSVSVALARAVGFRHEGFSPRYLRVGGHWRDHERFAMTREDWEAREPRAPRARPPLEPKRAAPLSRD